MSFRILYLSYDGLTDPLGQSQVIPYLVGLSQKGYRFTIISFEKSTRFEQHHDSIQKLLASNKIDWYPLIYHKSPPIVSTLYDIYLLQKTAIKLHKKQNFSIVHCRSYITALVGLALKNRFDLKFVFDMRGFWADERVEGGIWHLNNPVFRLVYRYFKGKEKVFLELADFTITLTEAAKKEIHSWKNIPNNPINIQVIPCCADLELFDYQNIDKNRANVFRKDLNIDHNDFILLYLGAIGTWYMLDEMLDFFKCLLKKNIHAKFLFVTTENPDTIYRQASIKDIDKTKLVITAANRNEVPALISLANFAIFFIKPVFSKKASSPTKQGEIMGMGIPIVCNDGVGDSSEIIIATGAGAIVQKINNTSYDAIINKLDEITHIPVQTIRDGAVKYYSLEQGINHFESVYQDLIER